MLRTALRLGVAFILLLSVLWFRSTLVSLWNDGRILAGGWDVPASAMNATASSAPGTPQEPDRVVVVGKMKHEDTDWVIDELPE